jgi:phage gp45-like
MVGIRELGSRLRNLFVDGKFKHRYADGTIQVETRNNMVVEKKEAYPYGFYAKATNGRAFVFCKAGSFDDFEIFPVLSSSALPTLDDGDAALYTDAGGRVIVRDAGAVELFGTDAGGVVKAGELKTQLAKLSARVDGVINALRNAQPVPQDGGSAYKAGIVASLSGLVNKEDFSDIESEKVFHGTE